MTEFQTYWRIGADDIRDFEEVERRVLAGETAIEISPAMQELAAQRRERVIEAAETQRQQLAEIAYQNSPEGRRQEALQRAAESGGAIVSRDLPDLAELDRHSARNTNRLQ